jgi:intein/homing endonuclease
MSAYYNEFDPFAAAWLRELIAAGHIAPGDVDERSIVDVQPEDLKGYDQVHFFAGIGGWSLAARLAGIPDDYPLWSGSCPCFPAGTLVFTKRGNLPIEEVCVGDEVLTHLSRWKKVTHVGSEYSNLVRLKGQGHWGLECTPGHPFFSESKDWVPASEMKGNRWRTVAKVPSSFPPALQNKKGVLFDRGKWRVNGYKNGHSVYLGRYASEEEARKRRDSAVFSGEIDVRGLGAANPESLEFARFLGYWVGDGWVSGDNVLLCGAKDHGPLLMEIMRDAGLSCCLSIEKTSSRARCGSKTLSAWLTENFGAGAASKRIPAWLHGMPEEYREHFLSGYSEADGHNEKNVRRWTTVSRALAVGVRILLNQQGVSASITRHQTSRKTIIQGRLVSERPFFRVTAYESARSFRFDDLHGIGLVREVEHSGFNRVYNLAVEEDETYVADGVVVHNCQPFSVAGRHEKENDERHLWPEYGRLVNECRPSVLVGEQVAGKDGLGWLDGVFADLEEFGYACAAADLPAASVGAPHPRQRICWAAYSGCQRRARQSPPIGVGERRPWRSCSQEDLLAIRRSPFVGRRGIPQPLLRRMDDGFSAGVAGLSGYGNAIVPQLVAEFLTAFMECLPDER